ncbi:hypothetical protein SRIMM317S_00201 [Streptomyces rimosus subsp. rimosus]
MFVEQWVGISTDEFHRAKDADVAYMRNRHPLIELDWSRADCLRYLKQRGLADTPKSSCLGCPFHGNAQWRHIRDHSPAEWADVVAFDAAIRSGNARANAPATGCSARRSCTAPPRPARPGTHRPRHRRRMGRSPS